MEESPRIRVAEPGFFDVVLSQRACRAFRSDDVDDEMVERALTAAVHAPSAENRQPWVFVVVRDATLRAAIGKLTRAAWENGGRTFSESRLDPALLDDVDRGATGGIANAPVIVVVCGDTERGLEQTLASSIYPATQNLLLAANALGLGSALTTLATSAPQELQEILDLPRHVRPLAVVPLGWPARRLGPARRDPVATHTHRDRYGQVWQERG